MKEKLFIRRVISLMACLLIFNAPLAFSEKIAGSNLSEADAYLSKGEIEDAQQICESILKEDPRNYGALWRLSNCYIWNGSAAKSKKEKKKEWKKAKDYAKQAVDVNPNGVEGHLYFAIATGKMARQSSAGEKVKSSRKIKEEAEKAIELDPAQPKAYLTLGVWHRSVATASSIEKQLAKMFFGELPAGTLEESLELLLKSVSLGGTNVKNYYELALTYEAMGNYEAAKREFENASAALSIYPDDEETKKKIKKILKRRRYVR